MTKRLMTKALGLAVALGAPALFSALAQASDAKSYIGSMCSWQRPLAANRDDHRLINSGSETLSSTCPIVKDSMDESVIEGAYVLISDGVPDKNCHFFVRHLDGSGTYYVAHDSHDVAGPYQMISWWPGEDSERDVGEDVALAIQCKVPQGSEIALYMVQEAD